MKTSKLLEKFKKAMPILVVAFYLFLINSNVKTLYYNYKMYFTIITFMYYLYYLDGKKYNDENNTLSFILVGSVTLFILVGYGAQISKMSMKNFIGYKWIYYAYFEWLIFILVAYVFALKVFKNELYAFNYVVQSICAGGFLYEIPHFINVKNGGLFTDRIANIQIFSIFMIGFMLYYHGFKLNKKIVGALMLYLFVVTISTQNYLFFIKFIKLQRIPTMLMLLTLLTGIKRRDVIMRAKQKEINRKKIKGDLKNEL